MNLLDIQALNAGGEPNDPAADTLSAFGVDQIQRRDYAAAERALRKALAIKEAALGPETTR
jgi:hypothetical protein